MTLPPPPIPSNPSGTTSAGPATALTPAAVPPSPPVSFPLAWIKEHASAAIRYRAITDVINVAADATIDPLIASLPFTHRPALALALAQQPDGTWNHSMLTIPSTRSENFDGIGTITAARRLLEYGWDKDTPPLIHARRVLFRLLAEDDDPEYLFEFAAGKNHDEDLAKRGRAILRESAAATLAQAGYEGDPRLRGAARRILERVTSYLRSPNASKPFVRVGNQHVLPPEAAPPSLYFLSMLAHMPLFRTEHHDAIELLYQYLMQPLPRQEPVQLCGTKTIAQPHLVLGDMLPNRNAADTDAVFAIAWLELIARLGFLRKNDNWSRLFDRFLDDRDANGVWHPHKGLAVPRSSNPFLWPIYPLEDRMSGEERWTDITFRLGLIARLSGRMIEVV